MGSAIISDMHEYAFVRVLNKCMRIRSRGAVPRDRSENQHPHSLEFSCIHDELIRDAFDVPG